MNAIIQKGIHKIHWKLAKWETSKKMWTPETVRPPKPWEWFTWCNFSLCLSHVTFLQHAYLSHCVNLPHDVLNPHPGIWLFWLFNPFTPKLIIQILPTIQEENDSDVVRNDCSINFHLSKLSISILYDISLVRDWKIKLKLTTVASETPLNKTFGKLTLSSFCFQLRLWPFWINKLAIL